MSEPMSPSGEIDHGGGRRWLFAVLWIGFAVAIAGQAARLRVFLTSNEPGMGGVLSRLDLFLRLDGSLGPLGAKLLGWPLQVVPVLVALLCGWLVWTGLRRDWADAAVPRGGRWLLAGLALRTGLAALMPIWTAFASVPAGSAGWVGKLVPLVATAQLGSTWALAVAAGMGLARLRSANPPAGLAAWALLLVPLSFFPVVGGAVGWIDLARVHRLASAFDVCLRHPWTTWALGALAGWALVAADRCPNRYWVAPSLFLGGLACWLTLLSTRSAGMGQILFMRQSFLPPLVVAVASGLLMVALPKTWMRVVGAVLLLPILLIGLGLAIATSFR